MRVTFGRYARLFLCLPEIRLLDDYFKQIANDGFTKINNFCLKKAFIIFILIQHLL